MRIPSHLYRNRYGTFYFRIVIPADLRQYFPHKNKEIRRSLKTRDRTVAIARCRPLSVRFTALLEETRRMTFPKIDPKVITEFSVKGVKTKHTIDGVEVSYDGLEIDPSDPKDLEAFNQFDESIRKRAAENAPPAQPQPGKIQRAPLSTVIRKFFDAHTGDQDDESDENESAWNPKTESEYLSEYQRFMEVVGDPIFADLGHKEIDDFIAKLKRIPKNHKKVKKYRDKRLSSFFEGKLIPKADRLSTTAVNKAVIRLATLFKWAVDHGYTDKNYAANKQLKKKKRADEEKSEFTSKDLEAVFYNTLGRSRHSYYHLLPLAGLLSACRLNELAQLHLKDIRKVDGIWVFDINDNTPDKRLKNLQSRRLVPVHDKLIELGLLTHIQKLKVRREERLFPELKLGRDGYSQSVSKWFGRFLDSLDNNPDVTRGIRFKRGDLSFHSFRHTAANHLKNKGVTAPLRAALLGHIDDQEKDSTRRYSGVYRPEVMKPIVDQLDYPLDIELLKVFNKKEFRLEDYL